MKKKTEKLRNFINNLHEHIVNNSQFRKNTSEKSETDIQTEIRPVIIQFLENYFWENGYADYKDRAVKNFYWEGQEGNYGYFKKEVFTAWNYPDFIITDPYWIAIEYKKGTTGSLVKQVIGQSIMHTLSEEYHYAYILFQDENKNKKIKNSILKDKEKEIVDTLKKDFNVFLRIV